MRAEILPGCPSLDRGSREAEVGFEPQTFRLSVCAEEIKPMSIVTTRTVTGSSFDESGTLITSLK
ncbi:hypothetical protein T265_02721 [Opisthorchis viverrini]|uniref:Uncharacterized protein n=1 Tax=Opisthorchis viverrini TaxID=6198 RepID=A0A074ZUT7_OPIVI|nr:hypothetical protein T265_02721 [Opisthorchis viverrini]KER30906.1 hypothetical protein T265_02721 [Opisthorchis viverrini]